MTERELRQALLLAPVPGELEAGRRTWAVARAAYEAREPVSRRSRRARPLLALAFLAALVTAALSPAGSALGDWIRDVVETKEPAPLELPAAGRLLVTSPEGAWVVQRDGAKRLLGPYREATWSPRGLFVATTRGRTLLAVEPDGGIRWTLTAPAAVFDPRWSPSGFRVAYRSGRTLRVVVGDGTKDRRLAQSVSAVPPAWRPGDAHVLAYVDRSGRVRVVDVDSGEEVGSSARPLAPSQVAWSPDGRRLLAVVDGHIESLGPRGRLRLLSNASGAERSRGAFKLAFAPEGNRYAYLSQEGDRTSVTIASGGDGAARELFTTAGRLAGLAWSPDGRWLVVAWPAADQWLFLPVSRVGTVPTVSDVSAIFDPAARGLPGAVQIAGWTVS